MRIFVSGLILVMAVGFGSGQTSGPARRPSRTGRIETIAPFHSTVLANDRALNVYLPPGYEAPPKRRYPVLYMHDGQNVFDGMTSYIPNQEWRADETAESLIKSGLIEPIIIVAIDNAGGDRANEFLPTKARMGNESAGGRADQYGEMLRKEIMPLINQRYRTRTGPHNTGLCGSSFGGIVTLHLGLTHPETFGKLAVVSPSIWWDNRVMLKRIAALPAKPKVRVWVDIGSDEGPGAERDAQDAFNALVAKGMKPGKEIVFYVDSGARHSEVAWAGRMGMILLYLFGKK
jgi:predicted alpha/beta superfamily hydrolase